ncbi:hypothetical protein JYJ95_39350 [Corallococcus exiguus]|uniref:hypothetical protein n=1 Tax=Corallococcus exiguus TaxID=83462 RepID=UPI001A8CB9F4|nr:hypothetical protein [Corallococcus exiguus]MBN8472596.1 hypothetical protein [Corallococcus exiguus]
MFKKTMRFSKVLSVMLLAGFSTAAQADLLYQCGANQTLWSDYEICTQNCYTQNWVTDYSNPNGGYWNTYWYGCFDYYTPPTGGGGGGSSGGGSSGGNWSDPFYQGQCDYNVMCPGANSCLCKGTGGEQQST